MPNDFFFAVALIALAIFTALFGVPNPYAP